MSTAASLPSATSTGAVIAAVAAVVQEEVGRNAAPLFAANQGGLAALAAALAAAPAPHVGLITGFFVPDGTPPAAETDGPLGAALLAQGLVAAGVPCRLATDSLCRDACAAALAAAGVAAVPLDAVAPKAPPWALVRAWREAGVTHALAIERCGPGADGVPRNMRGVDLSPWTAPLHLLFTAGPWQTLAIGDGGNELGMGALPEGLIARHVAHGADIACVVPAERLFVAGVSNWGCYGLIAALALLRPNWRRPLLAALDGDREAAILAAMVARGPAVDGVSGRQECTVDGLPFARHAAKRAAVRALLPF